MSWGLSEHVNSGDKWGYYVVYRGYLLAYLLSPHDLPSTSTLVEAQTFVEGSRQPKTKQERLMCEGLHFKVYES